LTRIRVLDFESTHSSPAEGGLCEIAYTDVVSGSLDLAGNPCDWEVVDGKCRRANPGCSIPAETSAIHHIIDQDVEDLPNWKPLLASLIKYSRAEEVIAFAAHSMSFESLWLHPDWMGPDPLPLICTYKAALRLWPDAPLHSNMGLRYHRRPIGLDRSKALPAHSAGPDSYVTAFHLRDMLNDGCPVQQLVEWTKSPALMVRCYLGDYRNDGKGTLWPEVETSFLTWILGKGTFPEDTVYTVKHHLEKRRMEEDQERERLDLNAQFAANGMTALGTNKTSVSTDSRQESLPL
jgi:exodeoxyribonuclease X